MSIPNVIQKALTEPYLHMGMDKMIGLMPDKINNWEGGSAPLGFSWEPDDFTSIVILLWDFLQFPVEAGFSHFFFNPPPLFGPDAFVIIPNPPQHRLFHMRRQI